MVTGSCSRNQFKVAAHSSALTTVDSSVHNTLSYCSDFLPPSAGSLNPEYRFRISLCGTCSGSGRDEKEGEAVEGTEEQKGQGKENH